jgi:hypothetical protein
MGDGSYTFGPTDSVAGTKTTVGTAAPIWNRDSTVITMRVAKGNVVDAKECAGFIEVEADGLNGPHIYAYGNGAGGATNSGNMAAEIIECSIPVTGNSNVTVSVTDAEAAKDVTVSLGFVAGLGRNVRSYSAGGAGQDTAADTQLTLTSTKPHTTKIVAAGTIKEIRFAGSGVVDAKAGSGILELDVPDYNMPTRWAIGNGPGGATLSGPAHADVIDLKQGIPVSKNTTITVLVTTAEIMLSASCSFQVA